MTTSEGFIVFEIDSAGKATLRAWILHSDVDANIFARSMSSERYHYVIKRANVAEFETKS